VAALETHPALLESFSTFLEKEESSSLSNTRKLKRTSKPVRELNRPFYQSSSLSGLQLTPTRGGGKSNPDFLSFSTLNKYKPYHVRAAIRNSMTCEDCAQRNVDANFMNRIFSKDNVSFFDQTCVGPLENHVGSLDRLLEKCDDMKMSSVEKEEVKRRFFTLRGTQVHFTLKQFQIELRRAHRTSLPAGHCVIVVDYGQNFPVGHKRTEVVATRRKLSQVTVFACSFEFSEAGSKANHIVHNVVFSDDLVHSAFLACRCMEVVLQSERVKNLLQEISVVHIWTDNGKHLSCAEHSTFLHSVVMKMFPKIRLFTENKHAAQHGKDLADAAISQVRRSVSVLEMEEGFL